MNRRIAHRRARASSPSSPGRARRVAEPDRDRGRPAVGPASADRAAPSASPRPPPAGERDPGPGDGDRPAGPRLDAEHEPHRVLRRPAERLATRDQAIDLQFLPYASTSPEILVSSGAAECGISTQEGATFAIAAGAKERSVMAILPTPRPRSRSATTARSPGRRTSTASSTPGFGLPQEVPELQAVIKADGGTGDVQGRDPRHGRLRGALRRQGRLHDHLQRLGGARGRRSATSSSRPSPSPTTGCPTRTPSSSSATTTGWRPTPTSPGASWRPRSPASSRRRPTRRRPRRSSSRRTRASSTRTPKLPLDSARYLAEHGLYGDADGQRRTPDRGAVGRPSRASCSTRGCWPVPTASRSTDRRRTSRPTSRTTTCRDRRRPGDGRRRPSAGGRSRAGRPGSARPSSSSPGSSAAGCSRSTR